jgi:hypothetical protein
MDARQRRQAGILGTLCVALAVVLAVQFWPHADAPSATPARVSGAQGNAAAIRRARAAAEVPHVIDVRVERLEVPPPGVEDSGRNPFRFQPKAPPAPPRPTPRPDSVGDGGDAPPRATATPPGPPPPAPIALKFIGMVAGDGGLGKVAVLSDGKFVYYGREGDIIEGRYRVVKIGEESIQMEYLDGRGRQTIRLSGA